MKQVDLKYPVQIDTDVAMCLGIICAIQLASKHPEFPKRDLAQKSIEFAKDLQQMLRPMLPTEMIVMLDNGWKSESTQN